MDLSKIFKKFNFKTFLKFAGIGVFSLIIIGLLVSLGSFTLRTAFNINPRSAMDFDYGFGGEQMRGESLKLSTRNIDSPMPGMDEGHVQGFDLEDFEITEYRASIRTSRLNKVCGEIESLKIREDIIFENSNKGDSYCNYRFKVEKEKEKEVLEIIQDMNPKDLNINTETIKKQIDDYTSEKEILTKRLEQIETTLEEAQDAYDEVTRLATKTSDVESLAKIINDKIKLIEKLTNERLNTKSNLDRLVRQKDEQLDRLDYTFFSVSVSEYLIIDFEMIKDSWRIELKNFVSDFNGLLQNLTIKLLSFGLILVQIAIYLTLALLIGKYGWRFVKFVWKK